MGRNNAGVGRVNEAAGVTVKDLESTRVVDLAVSIARSEEHRDVRALTDTDKRQIKPKKGAHPG